MKNDISKEIDLNAILEGPQESVPQQVQEASAEVLADFAEIVEEWSYRLPKGYPTAVDGVFTERAEVEILNKLLEERGLQPLPLPEESLYIITESATDDKENTVCAIIDILNLYSKKGAEELLTNHFNLVKAKAFTSTNKLHEEYKANKAALKNLNLQALSGSPFNKYSSSIGNVLNLLGLGRSESIDVKVTLNSISAGLIIFKNIANNKPINIFRGDEFNAVRKKATDIYKAETGQTITPDNWCPGDIYVSFGDPTPNALKADSIVLETKGKLPLNKFFTVKPSTKTFTAVSLKQQDAQAGKATTFSKNVFQTNLKLDSKPSDYLEGKNTDKSQLKLLKTIKRYEAYASKATASEQKQPATKILEKGLEVLRYAGVLTSRDKSQKSKELQPYFKGSVKDFTPRGKAVVSFLQQVNAVSKKSKKAAGDDINTLEKNFIQARKNFLGALRASNVDIKSVTKSEALFNDMQKQLKQDAPTYIVQKTATYDFFTNIFNDWTAKTKGSLKPHFQTLSKVANPFVALTMFAIAEAGISPPFVKAIGSEQSAEGAHMDSFNHDYVINNTTSAKEISITDSASAAGFDARFTMDFKTKKYSIKLSFRFSGTEIRVEVQELTKL